MPPFLPYAIAAIAALAVISTAEPAVTSANAPDALVVRAHTRWGIFATTEPVIASLHFHAASGTGGWTEADAPAIVASEGDLSRVITIAEITPCVARTLPSDDSAGRTLVQWSNDGGANWNNLTSAPEPASPVEQAGHNSALKLRYRARTAADSCAMRVVYTAVPAR
ncbi:MAG: hypothetical protein M3Y05_14165 [Gemmatimonadota bacterium]|nr:hypothetical protein [Gemmatimonadota bacterium]